MKLIKYSIFSAAMLLASAKALAQITQAEMQALFNNSRGAAAQVVTSTADCQIQASGLAADSKAWLLFQSNRQLVADDILNSTHSWSWGNYQTCATTLNSARSPVEFSYASCVGTVRSSADSTRVLIEQSLYHLGWTDAGKIKAAAEFLNDTKLSCTIPPAPFDQSICPQTPMTATDLQGYMAPGSSSKEVGSHQLYTRYRYCNLVTGCSGWRDAIPTTLYISNYGFLAPKGLTKTMTIYTWGSSTGHISARHSLLDDGSNRLSNIEFPGAIGKHDISVSLGGAGGIFRSCTWLRFNGKSGVDPSSNYVEVEAVYYGTH